MTMDTTSVLVVDYRGWLPAGMVGCRHCAGCISGCVAPPGLIHVPTFACAHAAVIGVERWEIG
jgi:hypothetical protein